MARKLCLLLVPLLLGLMAGPALAQATSTTTPFHGATDEFVDVNPCTGDPATIQLTYNGVFHESTGADGSVHVTGTQTGTIVVTRHHDQPGIVGAVGSALAEAGINISSLELSRLSAAGQAMMFVGIVWTALLKACTERL